MTDHQGYSADPDGNTTEMSQSMRDALAEGRIIEKVPLEAIDERYLVRDRLFQDEDELEALIASVRSRGQQTPIELVVLSAPDGELTHGLISGRRRLTALRRLFAETSDRAFAEVRALVIRPDTAQDAYLAMVEENEIRVNLSFYEKARIAVKAMQENVYPHQRAALQGLFGNTTRSRRSKIGTFIAVVESFDSILQFPASISEKLGLALAREVLRDPGFVEVVRAQLSETSPTTAAAEQRALSLALQSRLAPQKPPESIPSDPPRPRIRTQSPLAAGERVHTHVSKGIRMAYTPDSNRIELTGESVTERLMEDLQDWLRQR